MEGVLSDCLTDDEILRLALDRGGEQALESSKRHGQSCARCAQKLAWIRRLVVGLRGAKPAEISGQAGVEEGDLAGAHLDDAQIAAFVEGSLEADSRPGIIAHFASCEECRLAAVSLLEALGAAEVHEALVELDAGQGDYADPRPALPFFAGRRGRVLAGAAGLAAAVVAGVLLLRPADVEVTGPPQHRATDVEEARAPTPLFPVGGVRSVSELRWSPVSGADLYRVTIYDDGGTVVWEDESQDDRIAVPAGAELQVAVSYFWRVSARVDFDVWLDSRLNEFSIVP